MTLLKISVVASATLTGCTWGAELDSPVALQELVQNAVTNTVREFHAEKLKKEEVAVTVAILQEGTNFVQASFRGNERIYPASVVKLFYLEAAHAWMEQGKIADTPELRRAMRDMIVHSYNEPTHYILDLLTGTTSGPELPDNEMTHWAFKRNAVNRYFTSRGYSNINCNQKPWCEGPYGRDRFFVGLNYTNRNMLTTEATARLLREIAQKTAISPTRSAQMLELLERDPWSKSADPDSQSQGFTAAALPAGSRLWSKAGWTSQTRHDAAFVELPNGRRVVLAIFTINHASNRKIIPSIGKTILDGLNATP